MNKWSVSLCLFLAFSFSSAWSQELNGISTDISVPASSVKASSIKRSLESLGALKTQLDVLDEGVKKNPNSTFSAPIQLPKTPVLRAPAVGDFGHGYQSATRSILPNSCVKVASLAPSYGSVSAGSTSQGSFQEITKYESFRSGTGTSLSASVLYDGFSLGGGVQNSASQQFDSFSRYIMAYREIVLSSFIAIGTGPSAIYELSDAAKKITDLKTFKETCGDYFLSGYKTGGRLSILGIVSTNTDNSFKTSRTNVNIGFADIFGANFSQSTNYGTVKSASSFKVIDYSEGVLSPTTVTIETLQSAYVNYQGIVTADSAASGPKLLSFILTPYSSVIGMNLKPEVSVLTDEMLTQLEYKRSLADVIDNNLAKAETASAQGYAIFTVDGTLPAARTEINSFKQKVAAAVDTCRKATAAKDCQDAITGVGDVPPNHITVAP